MGEERQTEQERKGRAVERASEQRWRNGESDRKREIERERGLAVLAVLLCKSWLAG